MPTGREVLDYLATYLGPNPPKEKPAAKPEETAAADGEQVFRKTCAACHQPDGRGRKGAFPPLAGNADLFLAPDFPALVVLNGLAGPIEVEKKPFAGVMPAFGFLSDAEVAAVVGYVRGAWGNDKLRPKDLTDPTAEDVAGLREKPLSPKAVRDRRQALKK